VELAGRVAIVTGGAAGLGEFIVRRLASEGASVVAMDLDKGALAAREDEPVAFVRGDARVGADLERVVAFAVERFGGLDVLVNNAFSCHPDPERFELYADESWYQDFELTVHGAYRCCRAALPHLAAAGGRGAIVSVGSVNAERHFGNHAYSAAKAALAGLTRTLAVESAPRGVRVNLVEPGTVRTPVWAGREDLLERAAAHYPLGRVGEPEDVAAAIAFLASADAAWITGVTLPVDGGLLVSNLGMNRAFGDGS
jgi:meso-butanediol dehydrogenase / (S,S)-butanediol dehydrogenase / diacetyl reductase